MSLHATRAPRAGRALCLLLAVGTAGLRPAALGAQAGASSARHPTWSFASPGTHDVTLTVCNADGCDTLTRSVVVLDPAPAVTSAATSPAAPEAGQLLRLSGAGTGQPPLVFSWTVSLGPLPVAVLPGADVYWNTAGLLPGLFSAVLRVTNAAGTAESAPLPIGLLPSSGGGFFTVTPCRVLDTRQSAPLLSGVARQVAVATAGCGIPAAARAVAANLTAVAPSAGGHLVVYPGNYPALGTSNLGFNAGSTRAAFSVLPLATDGSGTLAATAMLHDAGSVHLILDVSGYFLPSP
jgi:hypothetical protein